MITGAKRLAIVTASVGAAIAAAAAPALAAGYGNTVNNCYGVYYNTDWDANCGAGGATARGVYNYTGDCTSSADRYVSVQRSVGNATSYDGGDCRFQVANVRLTFAAG